MRTNSFECPFCGKSTRHYELTLQEVMAMNADEEKTIKEKLGNRFAELLGGTADWTNLAKLYETIIGEIPYKCECCQLCGWRDSRGKRTRPVSFEDTYKLYIKKH